jgi:hypothetical protein
MLDTRDIIILTASFYLGGVVGEFFKSLSEDIITPLLAPAASAGKGVSSFSVTVGGITLGVSVQALTTPGTTTNAAWYASFTLVCRTVGLAGANSTFIGTGQFISSGIGTLGTGVVQTFGGTVATADATDTPPVPTPEPTPVGGRQYAAPRRKKIEPLPEVEIPVIQPKRRYAVASATLNGMQAQAVGTITFSILDDDAEVLLLV